MLDEVAYLWYISLHKPVGYTSLEADKWRS